MLLCDCTVTIRLMVHYVMKVNWNTQYILSVSTKYDNSQFFNGWNEMNNYGMHQAMDISILYAIVEEVFFVCVILFNIFLFNNVHFRFGCSEIIPVDNIMTQKLNYRL